MRHDERVVARERFFESPDGVARLLAAGVNATEFEQSASCLLIPFRSAFEMQNSLVDPSRGLLQ